MTVTSANAWKTLTEHAAQIGETHLSALFQTEKNRFDTYNIRDGELLLDYSKQRVTEETMDQLCRLARECHLNEWIEKLFCGDEVNYSENRPALHTALRLPADSKLRLNGENIVPDIQQNIDQMGKIVNRIHAGQWRGYSGVPIDTIVNIGVGGSDLGPLMASKALGEFRPEEIPDLTIHFVSSMDGSQLDSHLDSFDPAKTLFIISSKSFTTIDTLSNANTAMQWLRSASGASDKVLHRRHFIGVSSNSEKMSDWGIPPNSQLSIWDWVGGRYSMWSAIGLPIALEIGMDGFRKMLAGAHAMDQHFRHCPFENNLPVILALIGIWNINFLNIRAHAILPYDGRLSHLPSYLEQLEMESNGKSIDREGNKVDYHTCPILWGEIGPNAQHAFFQLLHQGTESVMCDIIVSARRYHQNDESSELKQQQILTLANCLAQSRILALGDSIVESEIKSPTFKQHDGNQPSTTLLLDELNPFSFGQLIALYEHKVFVQSVIWGINSFDQWGVELGKNMATALLAPLESKTNLESLDSSTRGLLDAIFNLQEDKQ